MDTRSCPLSSTSLETALANLVNIDGAGSWPPQASYEDSWPDSLRLFAQVARDAPPRFVQRTMIKASKDRIAAIDTNRKWMADTLSDTSLKVEEVNNLARQLQPAARSGFLACLAYLNHLYRWGILPVVSEAQIQEDLVIPPILSQTLGCLNSIYGIKTSGGCLYSMTLSNVDSNEQIVFSNMHHLQDDRSTAERYNAVLFYEMERRSYRVYQAIAQVQDLIDNTQDYDQAALVLREGNESLKSAFKYFFDHLRQDVVKKEMWMPYAQGFHGWNLNDDEGVSGDQSLLARTMDAFLDIPLTAGCPMVKRSVEPVAATYAARLYDYVWTWLPTRTTAQPIRQISYSSDNITTCQKVWIESVRAARLRQKAAGTSLEREINETLRIFKMWRLGHIKKALHYENLELEERVPMTAGGGQGHQSTLQDMLAVLEARLQTRISVTR